MKQFIEYSQEVSEAIRLGKPIVALESTIISHGMPYPQNVKTALECEKIIRDGGSVPATIAIINGKLKVGLSRDELEYFGKAGTKILKTSRRDIAYNLTNKFDGATTVAATMIIASLAGIHVFATGGVGGVHRGAETTMDISADLEELADTNVLVVSAGAKSILDLEKTLEYLETKGVEVVGYRTKMLPAFYSVDSDFEVPFKIDTTEEIAKVFHTKLRLQMRGGMLVANPIPKEYSMDKDEINSVIYQALITMEERGIKGKDTTPYLLKKVVELTGGASLNANIALVYNNCKVASSIAVELNKLQEN